MAEEPALRDRLDAAIAELDDAQRQRLLDWAGAMRSSIPGARAPGSSPGPIAEAFGIRSDGASEGRAAYALEVAAEMLNPHGVLHGGAIYTMVDYSMGAATMSLLPAGEICATIEIKISYVQAVREGTLRTETAVLKRGGSVVFLESRVTDGAGALVAAATGSFSIIRPSARRWGAAREG